MGRGKKLFDQLQFIGHGLDDYEPRLRIDHRLSTALFADNGGQGCFELFPEIL